MLMDRVGGQNNVREVGCYSHRPGVDELRSVAWLSLKTDERGANNVNDLRESYDS